MPNTAGIDPSLVARREGERRSAWTPGRAFAQPVWLASLVLLVINDHALKGAGVLPAVVTGKLSDVAGLLVAPAVLAWLARARTPRGWTLAHLAVGTAFSAVQLAPSVAATLDALAPWSARLWPDATDLLALPALAASWLAFGPRRRARRAQPPRRWTAVSVGLLALVACTATSRSTPPPRYPFRPGGVIDADVVLRHSGTEELVARVMRLRDGAELDCDRLLENPTEPTLNVPFAHDKSWTLARGDAIPLWDRLNEAPTRECYAVRLEVQGRAWVLAWRHGAPAVRSVELRLELDEPAEPEAVVVRAEEDLPRVPDGVTVRRL